MAPQLSLTMGYEGALFRQPDGRYRAPSFMLGLAFRRHYLPGLGLHVLLAPALGKGHMSGIGSPDELGHPTGDARVIGPSFTGIGEVGATIGPMGACYFLFSGQARLVVPRRSRARFVFNEGTEFEEVVVVRWNEVLLATGFRGAFGVMLGHYRNRGFAEFGLGAGKAFFAPEPVRYFTLGMRLGLTLGSRRAAGPASD